MGRDSRGQATVETVAMLPLLVLVALTVGQVLAAHAAATLAAGAAEAGGVGLPQDRGPRRGGPAGPPGRGRGRAPSRSCRTATPSGRLAPPSARGRASARRCRSSAGPFACGCARERC